MIDPYVDSFGTGRPELGDQRQRYPFSSWIPQISDKYTYLVQDSFWALVIFVGGARLTLRTLDRRPGSSIRSSGMKTRTEGDVVPQPEIEGCLRYQSEHPSPDRSCLCIDGGGSTYIDSRRTHRSREEINCRAPSGDWRKVDG